MIRYRRASAVDATAMDGNRIRLDYDSVRAWGQAHLTLRRILLVFLVCVILAVTKAWKPDAYPATWYDEGSYLMSAWSLAQGNAYALPSADGTVDYAPVLSVGPTLLLPTSFMMVVLGPTLMAGRIIATLYFIGATFLLYYTGSKLFGRRAGVMTLAVLLTMPALDWYYFGRQLVGEPASVFFLLLGGVLALRSRSMVHVALAGCVLGFSMVTKSQYVLVLPLTIVLIAAIDSFSARERPLRWYATLLVSSLAVWACYVLALLLLIEDGRIFENISRFRETSGSTLLVFEAHRMLWAIKWLLGPATYGLVAVGTIAGFLIVRQGASNHRLAVLSLLVFQSVWLLWFTTTSVAWPRYAIPGLAINALFVGYFLDRSLSLVVSRLSAWNVNPRLVTVAHWGLIAAIAGVLTLGASRTLLPAYTDDTQAPQRFSAAIDEIVPQSTHIDGWDPEIDFLSHHQFVYPERKALNEYLQAWLKQDLSGSYQQEPRTNYVVIGPWGELLGFYDAAVSSGDYALLYSDGPYRLYERVNR